MFILKCYLRILRYFHLFKCQNYVSMGEISEKIVETIISNIENVLESLVKDIRELPERKKSDKTWIFLRHLIHLVEHVVNRLRTTPDDEKRRRDYYWRLWHENRDTQEKLSNNLISYKKSPLTNLSKSTGFRDILKRMIYSSSVLTTSIEHQRQLHHEIIQRIHSNYIRNCQLVSRIEDKFFEDGEIIRLKFERTQINEYKQSEDHKNDLREICGISQNKLQNFKSSIRRLEQEMFHKRSKMIAKFLSLLNRYDTEIGERRNIVFDLETVLNDLMMRNNQLERNIEEQSLLYNSCFNEQEEAKMSEIKSKLEAITRNIAAKKIQRWWRSILPALKTRKKKKKKSKKPKKKKQRKN